MAASDGVGVAIGGTNGFGRVVRCVEAVPRHAGPTRGACSVREVMDGHRPAAWPSRRHPARQGHADRRQTCLAHLARDVDHAIGAGDDGLAPRPKPRLDGAFALARTITTAAPSTVTARRRKLERSPDDIPAAPAACDPARDIRNRMRRDRLLTSAPFPGRVQATNDACEGDLRPAVIQRRDTDGHRAMWSAKDWAAVRSVVATARMTSGAGTFSTVPGTSGARRRPAKPRAPRAVTGRAPRDGGDDAPGRRRGGTGR